MSVNAQIQFLATVTEVLEQNPDSSSQANRTITHALFNVTKQLNATSTPPATKTSNFVKIGEGDIDLTNLPCANNYIDDATGHQILYVRITNLGENELTIKNSNTNPHNFWGNGAVPVAPGGTIALMPLRSEVVDATHKRWTVSHGGTSEPEAQFTIVVGIPPV